MKPSKTSQLCLLALLFSVTGCGITPDEELYGTWVDLKLDGEITLRRDGTVNWYGQETTWTLTEPRSLSCVSHHLTWTCDKEIIIDNTEPPQSIGYISEELVANPDVIQERRGYFFFGREHSLSHTYRHRLVVWKNARPFLSQPNTTGPITIEPKRIRSTSAA